MTTWEEIKERVEILISEELDAVDFVNMANKAISELNEASYVEAPVIRYKGERLITEDPSFEISKLAATQQVGPLDLPFTYYKKSGDLEVTYDGHDITGSLYYEESGTDFMQSREVILDSARIFNNYNLNPDSDIIKFTAKFLPESEGAVKVIAVELPSNFSSMIRLEATVGTNKYELKEVSMNSFETNNEVRNTYYPYNFYIHNGYAYIITSLDIDLVKLHYSRRMNKLSKTTSLSVQPVEIDLSFENLLVYGTAHMFKENEVGAEDTETISLLKKYLMLKKEFETTNVARRMKRRQKSIETSV